MWIIVSPLSNSLNYNRSIFHTPKSMMVPHSAYYYIVTFPIVREIFACWTKKWGCLFTSCLFGGFVCYPKCYAYSLRNFTMFTGRAYNPVWCIPWDDRSEPVRFSYITCCFGFQPEAFLHTRGRFFIHTWNKTYISNMAMTNRLIANIFLYCPERLSTICTNILSRTETPQRCRVSALEVFVYMYMWHVRWQYIPKCRWLVTFVFPKTIFRGDIGINFLWRFHIWQFNAHTINKDPYVEENTDCRKLKLFLLTCLLFLCV